MAMLDGMHQNGLATGFYRRILRGPFGVLSCRDNLVRQKGCRHSRFLFSFFFFFLIFLDFPDLLISLVFLGFPRSSLPPFPFPSRSPASRRTVEVRWLQCLPLACICSTTTTCHCKQTCLGFTRPVFCDRPMACLGIDIVLDERREMTAIMVHLQSSPVQSSPGTDILLKQVQILQRLGRHCGIFTLRRRYILCCFCRIAGLRAAFIAAGLT